MPSSTDPASPAPNNARARRTSDILLGLALNFPHERVMLRDIGQLLGNRSFGFLLLIFALPNTLPLGIPGLSTLTGIPLALVALQMTFGMPRPYLPRWLADRSLRREDFRRLIERTAPWLQRLERVMKPRWVLLTGLAGERTLGTYCLALAVVLALPIPFGNVLPAIAIAIMALGLIEKDGVLIVVGAVIGVISLIFVWGVFWAMLQAAGAFFQHLVAD